MPPIPRLRSRSNLVLLAVCVAALGACVTPPPPPAAVVAPPPPPEPAPEPPPPPPAAPVVEVVPAIDVPRTLVGTLELLEAGDSAQAETELRKVLQVDPNNRLALSLMRQIRDEPAAQFGRESFSYRVQPGESLSSIAKRFLGDVHLFYGLARYDGIKVPRNLAGGQTIKVPGRAPAATAGGSAGAAPPPSAPQPAAVPASPAPNAATAAPATPVSTPAAPAQTEEQKKAAEIVRLSRAARAAFARQDLDSAVRNWEAVLALEPDNGTARTERQKALQLKENLKKVK